MNLLGIREAAINFYRRREDVLFPAVKFICAFWIFLKIGEIAPELPRARTLAVAVICGVLCAAAAPFGFILIASGVITLYLFTVSAELSILVFMGLFMLIVFYARLFPRESLLIPATVAANYFGIPAAVPLFAGIYTGIGGIVPVAAGTFIFNLAPYLLRMGAISPKGSFELLGMPDGILNIYGFFARNVCREGYWQIYSVIFAGVIFAMTFARKFYIKYGKEIIIAAGGGLALGGLTIASKLGLSPAPNGKTIAGIAAATLLVEAVKFFDSALQYNSLRNVQFEDADYYYYVKAVPKAHISGDTERKIDDFIGDDGEEDFKKTVKGHESGTKGGA